MRRRWARLTAVTVCAGLICGAVGGDIIYYRPAEPIHMQTSGFKTVDFDLDFNGVVDFVLRSNSADFDSIPQGGNSILSIPDTPPDMGAKVLNLDWGEEIGASPTPPADWVAPSTTPLFSSCQAEGCIGLWLPENGTEKGYFGVQFDIDGSTHYGWVYLDNNWAGLGGGDIIEWAYESTADMPILAGAGIVPEPSTFLMLTLGGLGLFLHGRKRNQSFSARR